MFYLKENRQEKESGETKVCALPILFRVITNRKKSGRRISRRNFEGRPSFG
jgi:hypothetical protein